MAKGLYVQGDKELRDKFRTLTARIEKKILNQALRKAAKLEQQRAKELVPVDTGLTRRNVKVRAMKRKKGRVGVSVLLTDKSFSESFYAKFPEYGTKDMPAQRNLYRAAEETHPKALDTFKAEVGPAIEREAKK